MPGPPPPTAPNQASTTPSPTRPVADTRPSAPADPSPAEQDSSSASSSSDSSSSDTATNDTSAPRRRQPRQEQTAPAEPDTSTTPANRQQFHNFLATLDGVDLQTALKTKFSGFQSPPPFLKGRVRHALGLALAAIQQAETQQQSVRAWKLWLLLPRMLLHRPTGVRTLPKPEWHARITAFQAGEWLALLRAAQDSTTNNSTPTEQAPTAQQQARRARQLVHQGELSAARQALTAGPLAPRTEATLQELRDPARRPAQPYQPIPEHVLQFQPASPTNLPAATLLANVRRARKGAAPGPSGLTAETLRLILDEESITNNFVAVATRLAQANIPPAISAALGLGRLVALSKPNGRVRGIVVGDLLRRVVARSLAQHHAHTFQQACSPHQYALSTRAGSEAVVHAITSLTELEPTSTILSIDGIGAYDTIARASMLQALAEVEGANTCLPFVRQFYATTSTYIWHDHSGQPHEVLQAEGGEQGAPLMPALFSLGQRAALQTVHIMTFPWPQPTSSNIGVKCIS